MYVANDLDNQQDLASLAQEEDIDRAPPLVSPETNEIALAEGRDAATLRLLSEMKGELERQICSNNLEGVSISSLMDLTQFSDPVLRSRLEHLYENGDVVYIPGRGRRPAFYFLRGYVEMLSSELLDELEDVQVSKKESSPFAQMERTIEELELSNSQIQAEIESLQALMSQNHKDVEILKSSIEVMKRHS